MRIGDGVTKNGRDRIVLFGEDDGLIEILAVSDEPQSRLESLRDQRRISIIQRRLLVFILRTAPDDEDEEDIHSQHDERLDDDDFLVEAGNHIRRNHHDQAGRIAEKRSFLHFCIITDRADNTEDETANIHGRADQSTNGDIHVLG